MQIKVEVFGTINDHKFTMRGSGKIEPETGEADIRMRYSCCPPEWSPLNYSDPLVLLPGYKEINGGMNFLSLAKGGFRAESNIDFGAGLHLRKTATVRVEGNTLIAAYSLFGSARVANISGIEPYEEHMIPVGHGQMIAVGLARWKTTTDTYLDAVVSSRYLFDEPTQLLKRHQIRRFEVEATLSDDGLEYNGKYRTSVMGVD